MSTRRPTLLLGEFGYTLRYRGDDYALITRAKDGVLFCWRCRKRGCEHIGDLNEIMFSEDEAA